MIIRLLFVILGVATMAGCSSQLVAVDIGLRVASGFAEALANNSTIAPGAEARASNSAIAPGAEARASNSETSPGNGWSCLAEYASMPNEKLCDVFWNNQHSYCTAEIRRILESRDGTEAPNCKRFKPV